MNIIIAGNMPQKIVGQLQKQNFRIFYTPCNTNVHNAIAYHPDTQAAQFDDYVVCDKSVYQKYLEFFDGARTRLLCGNTQIQCNYPKDVAYNIKTVGEYVFHNFSYTDSALKEAISYKKKIDVTQGYSGCSICKVSDCAIISSDLVIHRNAVKNGINSLLINPGDVLLPGFDCGFIGGASFLVEKNLYFFGDVSRHRDYEAIKSFCEENGTNVVSLSDEMLTDYGGAITFD